MSSELDGRVVTIVFLVKLGSFSAPSQGQWIVKTLYFDLSTISMWSYYDVSWRFTGPSACSSSYWSVFVLVISLKHCHICLIYVPYPFHFSFPFAAGPRSWILFTAQCKKIILHFYFCNRVILSSCTHTPSSYRSVIISYVKLHPKPRERNTICHIR